MLQSVYYVTQTPFGVYVYVAWCSADTRVHTAQHALLPEGTRSTWLSHGIAMLVNRSLLLLNRSL